MLKKDMVKHRMRSDDAGQNIGYYELFGFGLSEYGSNIWESFLNTFLLLFYTDVLLISPSIAGLIISVSVYWDAINDPLIANYADNHAFKNGDRCRPYLVIGSIPLAFFLVLLFTKVGDGGISTIIYCFVIYILFRIPSTFYNLPSNNMRQLATPFNDQRVRICTFTGFGGKLGAASSALAMWPLLRLLSGTDEAGNMINPEKGFYTCAIIVGLVVVVTAFCNFFTTKERVHPVKQNTISLLDSFKITFRNKHFVSTLIISFFSGAVSSIITGYSIYYCQYVICRPGLATPIAAAFMIGTILLLPFITKIYKRIGSRKALMLGASILLIAGVFFIIVPKKIISPFVFCFFAGLGCCLTSPMNLLNRANVTDIIEFNEGYRMDNMVTNIQNLVKKFANGFLTFIFGVILSISKYDGGAGIGNQPESAVKAIILILGLGTIICSSVYLIVSKNLTIEKELAEINELKEQGYNFRKDVPSK